MIVKRQNKNTQQQAVEQQQTATITEATAGESIIKRNPSMLSAQRRARTKNSIINPDVYTYHTNLHARHAARTLSLGLLHIRSAHRRQSAGRHTHQFHRHQHQTNSTRQKNTAKLMVSLQSRVS